MNVRVADSDYGVDFSFPVPQRSREYRFRDRLPLSRAAPYHRCGSSRFWQQQPEIWIPSWTSVLQWLTSWQEQVHKKTFTGSFQSNKLDLNCHSKQYLLLCSCVWWVCGILFKTVQQPMKYFLRISNSRNNSKKEDMQQWEQSTFYQRESLQLDIFVLLLLFYHLTF